MDAIQASTIIDSLADSIKANPDQFTIQIRVIGQSVVSHGGIGMSVSVTGGGPGSSTVGNSVHMGSGTIEIATGKADAAMVEQMAGLAEALSQISQQLKSGNPDKSLIRSTIDALQKSWVPAAITAVISAVTKSVLGG
ncbi:hypothetical protein [Pseudomonas chlororaphis]|uniref:hypothetical protein n=1 Tax=Pseudomonas chlororaphis TaxID=587753 RepID=UPI002368106F|nr:hypothetical protein [Pseudomonas chlororaphis]WDH37411.1 hypothetical protein PUP62_11480 [Pseudomonas chlororaphis]WDH43498.1 hypothetical protein PUP51_11485 [Pseudomonas chlororaphis]